jgi:hypothetical protein
MAAGWIPPIVKAYSLGGEILLQIKEEKSS